ncbi:MAG TPA: DsbA family protein, partial [Kribbella sp.]|nr:DsbA family protein [Kribbella sp.]
MNRPGPRMHFSFRSPYSWMASIKLRRRVPDAFSRLELIPYWDPDQRTRAQLEARDAEFHYAGMSKAKHLYILHDTRAQARRLGLAIHWPVDIDPWWELPHLAWWLCRRQGRGEQFFDALMAARWERGENICERPVIEDVCARLGWDAGELVAAPDSDELRHEAVEALVRAYHDDIFGIPYFRTGHHRFW